MIDDEEHPEWLAVRNALFGQVATIAAMHPFNKRLIEMLQELCNDCTKKAKARGLEFPDMIVCYFRQTRLVRIYRRDATGPMIDTYARTLLKEAPETEWWELKQGFRRAVPKHELGLIIPAAKETKQ